jgi:putative hydrolase of the HAD superfamily
MASNSESVHPCPSIGRGAGGEGQIRAVIFDIGGVLTTSPVAGIRAWAEGCGVDYAVLGPVIAQPAGAWSRFETSELSPEVFKEAFESECAAIGLTVDTAAFLASFSNLPIRDEMIAVVNHLKGRLPLGCITNNVHRDGMRPEQLYALFDVVIESANVNLRKPDPRIYGLACDRLGVTPREAVFLDDFGVNLKAARALGMTTIKVDETTRAIDELEAAIGIPLPRPDPA